MSRQPALAELGRRPKRLLAALAILSLAGGMWSVALGRLLRQWRPYPELSASLHQVELTHSPPPAVVRSRAGDDSLESRAARTRVSFPEYTALSESGLPPRQAASFRSSLLISTKQGVREALVARLAPARFVNAPFFPLFSVPITRGRAFDSAAEMGREPVVVLGEALSRALFGDRADPLERTVLIEGRPFRVMGVAGPARRSTLAADVAASQSEPDALYLPFGWFRPLRARPESLLQQSAIGPTFEDLLRSEALFISFWAELPTEESRQAFERHLDRRFLQRGMSYVLRDYPQWARAFRPPVERHLIALLLSTLALVGAGLAARRLLGRRAPPWTMVPEVIGALAALAGAWLLWQGPRPQLAEPANLEDDGLVVVGLQRPTPSFDETAGRQLAVIAEQDILGRIRSLRYVTAAAPVSGGIFTRAQSFPVEVSTLAGDRRTSGWTVQSRPELAQVLAVPLRIQEGAFPTGGAEAELGAVTVITRCLRDRLFPGGQTAVGRLVRSDDAPPARVVAVVEDVPLGHASHESGSCVSLRFETAPEERQALYLVRTAPRWRQSVLVGLRAELGDSGPERRIVIEPFAGPRGL